MRASYRFRWWFSAVGIVLSAACSAGATQHTASEHLPKKTCPAPYITPEISELVAASQLILIATARVPRAELLDAARSPSPDYLNIPLTRVEYLKGSPSKATVVLRAYPKDRPYAPSNAALLAAANAPNIFFLLQVDDGPAGLYFAGNTSAALQPASPDTTEAVRREIARQRRILDNWRSDPTLPYYDEVGRLIAKLTSIERTGQRGTEAELQAQQEVFRRLEALGEAAVPAIVAHMDDRRALAFHQISLVNHDPNAWESMRHYRPELVVDALAAILNEITGKSFGHIYNGGSEGERRAAVNGWRIYSASLLCSDQ